MNKLYKLYLILGIILFTMPCKSQTLTKVRNKPNEISIDNNKSIISVPIVFKNFVKKNGTITQIKEVYIQCSIQDYFIKFCESKISREGLENHLYEINGEIKTITLEIEFRDGNWDICDKNDMQQSRVGKYVIIHKIIKDKTAF